ncbi:MAG: hypothetical protein KJ645_09295 [Planctomycetes bacterium]|nr:hypothetical protein [Planctomycetota bacterium]
MWRLTITLVALFYFSAIIFATEDYREEGFENNAQSTTGPIMPEGLSNGYALENRDYQVVISDVPAYIWYNGCGPTATGMVIGYWDGQGFEQLVDGNAATQTPAMNDMISSSGNYNDYCLPLDQYPNLLPDLSEPPSGDEHPNDCVADCMKTSQSYHDNYYGWSWYSDVDNGFSGYVDAYSGEADHLFRSKAITRSGGSRSLVPDDDDHLSERSDAGSYLIN